MKNLDLCAILLIWLIGFWLGGLACERFARFCHDKAEDRRIRRHIRRNERIVQIGMETCHIPESRYDEWHRYVHEHNPYHRKGRR